MGANESFTSTAEIGHFIGGRRVAGSSGRTQAVTNPATGAVARRVALASAAEVDAAVAAAKVAQPAWADMPPLRRARVLGTFLDLLNREPRHARRDDHRRARQGVQRCAGRGDARHRRRRVRVRHPAAAEGRLHRAGLDRHRQLDDAPAARRRRRRHAVQLPGDGADVDVPGGDRVRQRLRAEAERARPVAVDLHGRAPRGSRPAERHLQRRPGRQGGRRRAAVAPRREGAQLRRLDADRALHLRDGGQARQAGPGARRRQEPHGRDARCQPRTGRRRADRRGVRLGGRALHGDLGGGAGGRRGRPDRAAAGRSGGAAGRQERHGGRRRDGSARQRRCEGPRRVVHRLGNRRRRDARGRRPRPRRAGPRERASSPAARCSTTSRPR